MNIEEKNVGSGLWLKESLKLYHRSWHGQHRECDAL